MCIGVVFDSFIFLSNYLLHKEGEGEEKGKEKEEEELEEMEKGTNALDDNMRH